MRATLIDKLLCVSAMLLCACASSVTLSVRAEQVGGTSLEAQPLPPFAALHSNDAVALYIKVDRPAYLYVLRYNPTSWSESLFPQAGQRQLAPSKWHRVPSDGADIVLDSQPGEEHLVVIASAAPLDERACRLFRLYCPRSKTAVLRGGKEQPPPPAPPPPDPNREPQPTPRGKSGRERDPVLSSPDDWPTLSIHGSYHDAVHIDFPLRHVPR